MGAYTKPRQRKKQKRHEEREITSSLLNLKESKLYYSGNEEVGKMFHEVHVLLMNADFWDTVVGLSSETWKECELSFWWS